MSVRVMTAVWDLELPDSEKIVLLALADCANDDGTCWPGMATLTRKCSKAERTIQGCIKALVDKGYLDRVEKPGKGCVYTVRATNPRSRCAPAETAPPQTLRDTPAAAAGKPSMNHHSSEAKASSAKRAKPKLDLPEWVPAEPWAAFVEMRRQTGHKLTDHAKHLAILELTKLRDGGNDPAAVLNQSTLKSWRGLFEVKRDAAVVTAPHAKQDPNATERARLHASYEAGEITFDEYMSRKLAIERPNPPRPRTGRPPPDAKPIGATINLARFSVS